MSGNERIAVLGGTGNLGAAIARRLAKAGRSVVIGSRSQENADKAAAQLGFGLTGMTNADAVQACDIVILTVPFEAHARTLETIAPLVGGKLVVDTTVPLVPPKVMRVQMPAEGSAAELTRLALPEGTRVTAGFHSVAAHKLITDNDVDCDVLVFGDSKADRQIVIELAELMGLRGIHGGALVNSAAAEALTSVLIFLNKTYQVDGAGIRITGKLVPPA
jgi:NADPH-dependent F420 reductase